MNRITKWDKICWIFVIIGTIISFIEPIARLGNIIAYFGLGMYIRDFFVWRKENKKT